MIITPASGFVDHTAAFMMGVIGTPVVYLGVQVPQPRLRRAVGGCALSQLQRRGATVPSLHPPPPGGVGGSRTRRVWGTMHNSAYLTCMCITCLVWIYCCTCPRVRRSGLAATARSTRCDFDSAAEQDAARPQAQVKHRPGCSSTRDSHTHTSALLISEKGRCSAEGILYGI